MLKQVRAGILSVLAVSLIVPQSVTFLPWTEEVQTRKKINFLCALIVGQAEELMSHALRFSGLAADDSAHFEPELADTLSREEIIDMQRGLADTGFSTGAPDGQVGPATRRAITNYKAENALPGSATATVRLLAHVQARAFVPAADPGPAQTVEAALTRDARA